MDGSAWVERRPDEAPQGTLAHIIDVVSIWHARAQQRRCLAALS